MNEKDIAREIDREVSGHGGLIALSISLGAVAVIVLFGAIELLRPFL